MQRVAARSGFLGVGFADPQATVAVGIVQQVAFRGQYLSQVIDSYPFQYLCRGRIGGDLDHLTDQRLQLLIHDQPPILGRLERPQHDGDLWQTGSINHVVVVVRSHARPCRIGNIYQCDHQLLTFALLEQIQLIELPIQGIL